MPGVLLSKSLLSCAGEDCGTGRSKRGLLPLAGPNPFCVFCIWFLLLSFCSLRVLS